MPHKRAKRSIREKLRSEQGEDLVPSKQSLSTEAIPKSLARVLNAASIREEFKVKKRMLEEGGDSKRSGKRVKLEKQEKGREERTKLQLKIKPGESIQHFNRRVEDDMRPLVKSAMQTSNAVARNAHRAEIEAKVKGQQNNKIKAKTKEEIDKDDNKEPSHRPPSPVIDKHANGRKEFEKHSSSTPRRLNDTVQAPPEFKKLPRGAATALDRTGTSKREGVLSMAQKSMMEKERENAIVRYREMKANRKKSGAAEDERS